MVSTEHPFGLERNHYAVVAVDSAGLELRGWDFRTLAAAENHGERLRLKGLRVEVWSRDELGRKLARLLPGVAPNRKWVVISDEQEGPGVASPLEASFLYWMRLWQSAWSSWRWISPP